MRSTTGFCFLNPSGCSAKGCVECLIKRTALFFQHQRTSGKLDFDFNHFYELSVFVFLAQVNIAPNRIDRYSAQLVQLLRNHSRQTVAVFDVYGMDNSMHVFLGFKSAALPGLEGAPAGQRTSTAQWTRGCTLGWPRDSRAPKDCESTPSLLPCPANALRRCAATRAG